MLSRNIFEENGFSQDRISKFVEYYIEYLQPLKTIISSTGFHFPHITDVEWRMDLLLKSDSLEKENTPLFFIKFKVMEYGIPTYKEFTATLSQMQDLVNILQDATSALERLDLFI
eukprot:TRINITY_DN5043_c0_g1_i2.p1 TRINITY_DN5043_c0_g1~~TRINITY_DN5043_c0_g1_i2.p1  ORF type:complete len:115 (-),score=21.35 TRINITY_DN5043_c0_g1_i2:18-362(-)